MHLQLLIKFAFCFQHYFSEGLGGFEAFNQVCLLGSTFFFFSLCNSELIFTTLLRTSGFCTFRTRLKCCCSIRVELHDTNPQISAFFQPLPSGPSGKFLDGAAAPAGRTNLELLLKFCLMSGSDCKFTLELLLGFCAGYLC